jgi:hypothetical protein
MLIFDWLHLQKQFSQVGLTFLPSVAVLGRVVALGPARASASPCPLFLAFTGVYFLAKITAGIGRPTFRAVTPNQQGSSCQSRSATKRQSPLADFILPPSTNIFFRNFHDQLIVRSSRPALTLHLFIVN